MCKIEDLIKLSDDPRIWGALQELGQLREEKLNNNNTFNNYQELAGRTLKCDLNNNEKLSMLAMGLSGESGEVTDLLKKHIYHKHGLDLNEIEKELGDVLWYLSGIATELGFTLKDIMITNINKLEKRYPNGFNNNDSVNRIDDKLA